MTLEAAATGQTDDTFTLPVRVVDVKPSDHQHYGVHVLITLEPAGEASDLRKKATKADLVALLQA